MEVGGNDPIGWIDKTWRRNRNQIYLTKEDLKIISPKGKNLGNYFNDDCRNAIAHLFKRKTGKTKIKVDDPEDNIRIAISKKGIKEFAKFYIKNELELQKHLWLIKKGGGGFPTYVNDQFLKKDPL